MTFPLTFLYHVLPPGIRKRAAVQRVNYPSFCVEITRPLSVSTDDYPRTHNAYGLLYRRCENAANISSCRRAASRRRAYRFARSRVARHTTSESNNEAPPPPPPPLSHLHRRIFCVFQMNRAPIADARPTRDARNNRRALNNLRVVGNNPRK